MSTGVLAKAKKFVALTDGMSRAQELGWLIREFGIDELAVLRLLGYRPADAAKRTGGGATFEDLAEAKPEQTIWVSEVFRAWVDRFGYDMALMTEAIGPRRKVTRPSPTGAANPERQMTDASLLREIQTGGPDVVHYLTEYLRRNPSPARPRKPDTRKTD